MRPNPSRPQRKEAGIVVSDRIQPAEEESVESVVEPFRRREEPFSLYVEFRSGFSGEWRVHCVLACGFHLSEPRSIGSPLHSVDRPMASFARRFTNEQLAIEPESDRRVTCGRAHRPCEDWIHTAETHDAARTGDRKARGETEAGTD